MANKTIDQFTGPRDPNRLSLKIAKLGKHIRSKHGSAKKYIFNKVEFEQMTIAFNLSHKRTFIKKIFNITCK